MSDRPEKQPPGEPPESEVLARLPGPGTASGLHTSQPPTAAPRDAAPADEPLTRPRGALVAMRKSGGIRFSWRLVVVRQDGRVIYKSNQLGALAAAQAIGQLQPDQLAELRSAIERADFAGAPAGARQNPDAFAYEIIARVGRRNSSAEAFQGSIPAGLQPLIRLLDALMPAAEASTDVE
jgi:hypothetical protein